MWVPGSILTAPALFVAGVVSSAHCTLMCGALGAHQLRNARSLHARSAMGWLYAGRLVGYSALGAIAGGLGQSVLLRLPDPFAGTVLQAAAALVLILLGLRYARGSGPAKVCCTPPAPAKLASLAPEISMFARGVLWAALPCGILYSALLLAAFTGTALAGAGLLAAFALGGTPMLAAATWTAAHRGDPARSGRRAGYWMIGFGAVGLAWVILMAAGPALGWCRAALVAG